MPRMLAGALTSVQLWLLFCCALLAACGKPPVVERESYVFGTLVQVKTWGATESHASDAIGAVLREFDRLHRMLHAWQPSELTKLNAGFANGSAPVAISQELAAIVAEAQHLAAKSDDLFNPAIGRLIALWGFHNDEFQPALPEQAKIDALVKANPRMSEVQVQGSSVSSVNSSVQLDLGGYAKGYALDRALQLLKQAGIENALVNIGGNIIAMGRAGNRPWKIGVQHPRKPAPILVVELQDGEAIGTSGDYQRYFELRGKRYSHLVDPRTGVPVQGVQAVTVIARPSDELARAGRSTGVLSDVASKPIFVAGVGGWRAAAAKMGVNLALLIDAKGEVHLTQAFAQRAEFVEKNLTLHALP